jgi:hypothetical protein
MDKELEKIVGNFGIKEAIRLALGGYMFDGGDVLAIPDLLKEMADEYQKEIDNNNL